MPVDKIFILPLPVRLTSLSLSRFILPLPVRLTSLSLSIFIFVPLEELVFLIILLPFVSSSNNSSSPVVDDSTLTFPSTLPIIPPNPFSLYATMYSPLT